MRRIKYLPIIFLVLVMFVLVSCNKKNKFLDKKPRTGLIIPSTLADFQRLMDGPDMNTTGILGELSSDDYYILNASAWQAIPLSYERNAYIWARDLYEGYPNVESWDLLYKQVLVANVVLEGLNKILMTSSNQNDWKTTKGRALFIRGFAYFNLAQQFTLPYDPATAPNNLGVVIRKESDVSQPSKRSTLKETYDQILSDLNESAALLPDKQPGEDRNRPYLSSAYAALARVYLSMRMYTEALQNAGKALALYNEVIDYNTLDLASRTPFTILNKETMLQATLSYVSSAVLATYRVSVNTIVDSALYASYDNNDLRKQVFYRIIPANGKMGFVAGYSRITSYFSGFATNELYLIKAECEARANNVSEAMNALNHLLQARFTAGTFVPVTAANSQQALEIILQERRKELILRGLRWQDLRRLNLEGKNITLTRNLNSQIYQLPPNSPLYALPIPPEEIRLSGIEQNPR